MREVLKRQGTPGEQKGTEKNLVELQTKSGLFSTTNVLSTTQTHSVDGYYVGLHEVSKCLSPFSTDSFASLL